MLVGSESTRRSNKSMEMFDKGIRTFTALEKLVHELSLHSPVQSGSPYVATVAWLGACAGSNECFDGCFYYFPCFLVD